jgi:hypothetical protein
MREQQGLGQAVDARLRREQAALEQRATLGQAGAAPLASGGTAAGGGPVTTDPALPESFVTGLAGGTGNPFQAGELTITGSGAAEVTQDSMAGEIDVHSPAYTAGDGLDLSTDEFAVDATVVRTSGAQSVAGLKTFSTLPQSPATPSVDADLTTKDYVDERTKVVHRQVFHAAGSKDSVNGNNEINLPWGVSAFPAGASLPTLQIQCQSDITFSTSNIAKLDTNYVEISWTSDQVGGVVTKGVQAAFAASMPKYGSTIDFTCSIRLVNVSRFSSVYLTVNDSEGNISPESPTNLISELVDNQWITLETLNISLQSLSSTLAVVITINGTTDSMNIGNSVLQVREFSVEQLE